MYIIKCITGEYEDRDEDILGYLETEDDALKLKEKLTKEYSDCNEQVTEDGYIIDKYDTDGYFDDKTIQVYIDDYIDFVIEKIEDLTKCLK